MTNTAAMLRHDAVMGEITHDNDSTKAQLTSTSSVLTAIHPRQRSQSAVMLIRSGTGIVLQDGKLYFSEARKSQEGNCSTRNHVPSWKGGEKVCNAIGRSCDSLELQEICGPWGHGYRRALRTGPKMAILHVIR